ncbi:MAG: hypothetical protein J1F04_04865 [Oscillospiraceae bacterium]|nr:hypothetical protein [Oscillospiraceae bacterium]
MNNKQFLNIFNDIDEEIIQQANEDVNAWLKDRSGIVVRSDERRGFLRKTIITSAACAAAVLSGVFIMNNFIPAKPLENSNDSHTDTNSFYHFADPEDMESKAESDGWEIQHIKENYPVYHSAEELVSDADVVFVGTVRNYGTAYNLNVPLDEPAISDIKEIIELYLHGEVEVITPYKGTASEAETIKFGFTTKEIEEIKELYSVEEICEQSATGTREIMIGTASGKKIMIVYDMPEIKTGETYLFCLKADGNAYNFTVNPYQSVINISEPFAKDKYGYLSAEDIISYFGEDKWSEFLES